MRKKLLFVTGTRADFGKIKSLIKKVQTSSRFEYKIFATGMHMLRKYGSTIHEIYKSGFKEVHAFLNQDDTMGAHMDYVTANTINGLGIYVKEFRPDMIVVHGDRVEALAGAIVGMLNNILVAHIEGGELSGTVDGLIRHAISKLAHIHFVTNNQAAHRLIQMGELKERIFIIGSPEIDTMLSNELPSIELTKSYYEIPYKKYSILIYHPVTTKLERLREDVKQVIDATIESGENYVVIYPNNDLGSEIILDELKCLSDNSRFRILPSMRFEHFLTLLKHANMCLGNSSSGVREAPVYGVPTVNIGDRQASRSNASSIINVFEDKDTILTAIMNIPTNVRASNVFGDGRSAELFMDAIKQESLWKLGCQKYFNEVVIDKKLNTRE